MEEKEEKERERENKPLKMFAARPSLLFPFYRNYPRATNY
jgi:hypothetical protein